MLQTTIDEGTEVFTQYTAAMRRVRILDRWQWVLTAVCWGPLSAAIYFKFSGTFTELVLPLSLIGFVAGAGGWLVGRQRKRLVEDIQAMNASLKDLVATAEDQYAHIKDRIPLVIGFYPLADDIPDDLLKQDREMLSPLFMESVVAEGPKLPKSQVAFIYARLNEDGTIRGHAVPNIRELAYATDASIVVLASENSATSIKNAISQLGPKKANLVFTLDRNGDGFTGFFADLFTKMQKEGKHMPMAWVELAPQGPYSPPAAPRTLMVAEGGKIAFPRTA